MSDGIPGDDYAEKPQGNDLLYRLARHLLNPDDIPLHKWAVKGASLLSELERIDPERYKKAMKPRAV